MYVERESLFTYMGLTSESIEIYISSVQFLFVRAISDDTLVSVMQHQRVSDETLVFGSSLVILYHQNWIQNNCWTLFVLTHFLLSEFCICYMNQTWRLLNNKIHACQGSFIWNVGVTPKCSLYIPCVTSILHTESKRHDSPFRFHDQNFCKMYRLKFHKLGFLISQSHQNCRSYLLRSKILDCLFSNLEISISVETSRSLEASSWAPPSNSWGTPSGVNPSETTTSACSKSPWLWQWQSETH